MVVTFLVDQLFCPVHELALIHLSIPVLIQELEQAIPTSELLQVVKRVET